VLVPQSIGPIDAGIADDCAALGAGEAARGCEEGLSAHSHEEAEQAREREGPAEQYDGESEAKPAHAPILLELRGGGRPSSEGRA